MLGAGAFGGPVVGPLNDDGDFEHPGAESTRAAAAIERATGTSVGPRFLARVELPAPFGTPAADARLREVVGIVERDPGVAGVAAARPGDPRTARLVATNRRSTYVAATFRADASWGDTAVRLQERVEAVPGVTAGGAEIAAEQVGAQVSEDLARAEMLAFPILFALSLVVFRGLVAALRRWRSASPRSS